MREERAPKLEGIALSDLRLPLEMNGLLNKLRLSPESEYVQEFVPLLETAKAVARPRAFYLPAKITAWSESEVSLEGIAFRSRVLALNLRDTELVFPFLATCGRELGEWARSLSDPLHQSFAHAVMEQALAVAFLHLRQDLAQRFCPGPTSMMSPGSLEDWPLAEQRPLFSLLGPGPEQIGVRLLENCFMEPLQSVSGIFFPSEERFESCLLCPREKCPGRRAQYDPTWLERKEARKREK